MAFLKGFGAYVPERRVSNQELAQRLGCTAEWILSASGIEERRFAAEGEGVVEMAVAASQDCLARAGMQAAEVGMVIVSSGSAEQRFPGPATSVAKRLGCGTIPAWDLPLASAGGLLGMALATDLAARYGTVLVVAAEKMSGIDCANRWIATWRYCLEMAQGHAWLRGAIRAAGWVRFAARRFTPTAALRRTCGCRGTAR